MQLFSTTNLYCCLSAVLSIDSYLSSISLKALKVGSQPIKCLCVLGAALGLRIVLNSPKVPAQLVRALRTTWFQ